MERGQGFYEQGDHFAIDLPGARALFTTRRGGHSEGPYRSLNLGLATDDDPAAVAANRRTLEDRLGGGSLRFVHQVHGSRVRRIADEQGEQGGRGGRGGRGVGGPIPGPPPQGDGQATNLPGIAPVALTADCLPIAVAGLGAVAMLHAGWRGLASGVIAAGVAAVRELGAQGELRAAIGPGAGGCCYEVGPEVHAAFTDPRSAHRAGGRLDLKAIAAHQLRAAGVATVADIGLCTLCCDPDLLFSHRRDRGITGRQAGVAWLT
jgi:YfiH family protein